VASAREIVHRLIEAEDPDSPESFGIERHLDSPVARLALANGFVRSDRIDSEERYVKKLSDGSEAWLRTQPHWDFEQPMDFRDPQRHGGRTWEFLLVRPRTVCKYCNQDRPAKRGLCPHCKKSSEVDRFPDYHQIARGSEMTMNYLLGAVLQRLATWPEHLPKPGQPGWKKAFE